MPSLMHFWYICITIDWGISNIRSSSEKDYLSLYHATFESRYNSDQHAKDYITAFAVCHQLCIEQQYDAKQKKISSWECFCNGPFLCLESISLEATTT